ncbi:ABC transporter substrate-binding protein [Oscillospiraceae bacterium LTW-04]|nr:ABC transporter substrate-binding protein [Oscillospiraceae bacterium MB24-C1]
MKKLLYALLACMLLILSCACGKISKSNDDRWPVSVGDTTFTHVPKRVISLSPALTDTLFALGYGGRIVGVSDYCELPETAQDTAACGTALMPDADTLLQLEPDIIFCSATLPTKITKSLEAAGVQIIVVTSAQTLDGILENYRLLCTAFEGSEMGDLKTEQLSLFVHTTLDYVSETVSSALSPEENKAVYLRQIPFVMATGDTLEGGLLTEMGFVNQGDAYTGWNYPLEAEPDLNPNYIFCDESISLEALQSSDYYKRTSAVTHERVYTFDARMFERQSPRMFFELEDLMKRAFPEAFVSPKPSFVMDMPEPEPEPEKTWWQKLFSK